MPARFPFPADFFRMPLVDPQTGIITPEAALMLQTSLNADNLPDGSGNQLTISNNLLAPSSPFNGDNEQWADTDFLPYGWSGAYLAGSKAVGRNNYRRSGSPDAFRGNYAQLLFCGANLTDIASRATRPEDVKEFLQYEFNGRAKVTLRPSAGNHGYRIEVDWFSSDASLVRGGSGFLSTSVIQSGAATPFAADNVYQSFNSTVTAPAGAKFARIVEASDATLRTVAQQIAVYSDTWTWKLATLSNLNSAIGASASPTTASGAFAVIPEMAITQTTRGGKVLIIFTASIACDNAAGQQQGFFAIFRDGVQVGAAIVETFAVANFAQAVTITHIDNPAAGNHTFDVRWKTNGGGQTLTASTTLREIETVELS